MLFIIFWPPKSPERGLLAGARQEKFGISNLRQSVISAIFSSPLGRLGGS
jgi:hypothetical protein